MARLLMSCLTGLSLTLSSCTNKSHESTPAPAEVHPTPAAAMILRGLAGDVACVAFTFNADSRWIAACSQAEVWKDPPQADTVVMWERMSGDQVFSSEVIPDEGQVKNITVAPDSKTLAVSCEGATFIYGIPTGKALACVGGDLFQFGSDGQLMVSYKQDRFRRDVIAFTDSDTLKFVKSIYVTRQEEYGPARAMAICPDGDSVAFGYNRIDDKLAEIVLFSLLPEKAHQIVKTNKRSIRSLSYSRDGKQLAVRTERYVQILSLPEAKETASRALGFTSEVVFHPNGREMAFTEGGDVKLWAFNEGDAVRAFSAGNGVRVRSIAISVDGRWLAAGCSTGDVVIWKVTDAASR